MRATHYHILQHHLVSQRQATRQGGYEISLSLGVQRLRLPELLPATFSIEWNLKVSENM